MRTPSGRLPPLVVLAAVAVFLLVLGVATWALHDTGPTAPLAAHFDPSVSTAELDRLARPAPCDRVIAGQPAAGRNEIARFHARAVVNCRTSERTYPGAGVWQVLTREVAARGLARLLDALTRPDTVTSHEQICPAIAYRPLTILLAGPDGHYLHPRAPAAMCGGPQAATLQAIAALRWRTVSVTKIQIVTSPAASLPAARWHGRTRPR